MAANQKNFEDDEANFIGQTTAILLCSGINMTSIEEETNDMNRGSRRY